MPKSTACKAAKSPTLSPLTDTNYAEAVSNFNDALSLLGLDGDPIDDPSAPLSLRDRESLSIVALKESLRLLSLADGASRSALKATMPWRAELAADALVLRGRIIEWRDPTEALALFREALDLYSPSHRAANLEYGRLQYKLACSSADLDSVEAHLERAAKEADDDDDDDDDDDTRMEAEKLLARLYRSCGPDHKWGGEKTSADKLRRSKDLLRKLGFNYALTQDLTAAKRSDAQQLGPTVPNSPLVSATDQAFPPKMLAHLVKLFQPSSNFWAAHRYSSPTTGFFSYSIKLSKFPATATKKTTHPSSFVHIIHHIWATAALSCPGLKDAAFAEWWAHSRPHSNGHKLHFDYVVGPDGKTPLHPIASTISFITASVGGPTLVTSQTMSNEKSSDGWILFPEANRLAHFDGSLLHCVLPGSGFNPEGTQDARRLTIMVAFWKDDPRSTPHPTKTYVVNGHPATWVGDFNEVVEGMEAVGTGGPAGAARKNDENKIIRVEKVFETIATGASRASTSKRQKKASDAGVDLLADDVFSFFGALDSGILIQNTGCSLNCQGGCAVCRETKSHK